MAKKKDQQEFDAGGKRIKEETRHGIIAIICFALTIFFILASLDYAGRVGTFSYRFLSTLFGTGFFIIPLILTLLGISFLTSTRPNFVGSRLIAGLLSFLSLLGIIRVIFHEPATIIQGGLIGKFIAIPLFGLFDFYSLIILVALFLVSILVIFDTPPRLSFFSPWRWFKRSEGEMSEKEITAIADKLASDTGNLTLPSEDETREKEQALTTKKPARADKETGDETEGVFGKLANLTKRGGGSVAFTPPPLSLLEKDSGKPGAGDIKANANIIKRTLQNFGIVVEMEEVSIGPSITRYAFKPAEGVKLSRIVALQNDLALALAAHPLRIEAPIPGKSLVGIEIPNRTKSIVGLASLLGSDEFNTLPHPLLIALGRGISGTAHFSNLAKAPHLLVAGATGSGKSVAIHTFITSLLYRNPPDRLRFIMIDPKRVELTLYNSIPHLLTPVVTDAKKAILVLKWAAKEMERRYNILETCAVRDIQSYHKNIKEDAEKMPYIVIVIDELADIMTAYPRELESAIVRLAQMSRAVGIHLILSTQRPSVEVITGLIKANIPSRVALQVASQIDSRTILDMGGAEKLLGSGDMLYLSGEMSKPNRLQSAFVSEEEVKNVVKYLVKNYESESGDEITLANAGGGAEPGNSPGGLEVDLTESDEDNDELYEEARETVIHAGKASASYLQRKLKIGYARAARLLDMLEERGVIGPGEGAKQREVYEKAATEDNTF